jgi:hypothetical protein
MRKVESTHVHPSILWITGNYGVQYPLDDVKLCARYPYLINDDYEYPGNLLFVEHEWRR